MTQTTSSSLMDSHIWTGKIFNGDWTSSAGGEYPVTEPATGNRLGVLGRASIKDVSRAAEQAAEAQKAGPHGDRKDRHSSIRKQASRRRRGVTILAVAMPECARRHALSARFDF